MMLLYFTAALNHDYEGRTVSARVVHCNVVISPFLFPKYFWGAGILQDSANMLFLLTVLPTKL